MTTPDISSDAPPRLSPSGAGEGASLNLSGLSEDGITAAVRLVQEGRFDPVAETVDAVHNCARPIRLVGHSETYEYDKELDALGRRLSSFSSADTPLGVLYRPCGNRRADVCPACSRTYARDTFELIRAGVAGGKTIPETVADNPLLFVTLTAPSFGHVHGPRPTNGQPTGGRCRPRNGSTLCEHGRPTGCMAVHEADDAVNGSPICADCHDQTSAVVWQWWAPKLWQYTQTALKRALASRLAVPERRLGDVASVQFAKVAEYQARGLVHFHALIRLDGPKGPGNPAPLDGHALARVVQHAVPTVHYTAPPVDDDDTSRVIAWGKQLDIKTVRAGARTDDPDGPLTAEQVAGYLAKYATKDANSIRSPGEPRPHLVELGAISRDLAARARDHYGTDWLHDGERVRKKIDKNDVPVNPYHFLAKWSHMLGFRGHFGTKSRGYSVTLGQLRRARQRYQQLAAQAQRDGEELDTRDLETRLLADDDETTRVIGEWTYQGTGWTHHDDEALALAAAARAREYDQLKAARKTTGQLGEGN